MAFPGQIWLRISVTRKMTMRQNFWKTREGLGKTGGDEYDGGAATAGEDVVEEDDACGDPRLDSSRVVVVGVGTDLLDMA